MKKQILYLNLDHILVNFATGIEHFDDAIVKLYEGRPEEIPGIYSLVKAIPEAIKAYKKLSNIYDIYIISSAAWSNSSAWSEKLIWVKKYLGESAFERLILTQHINLIKGDFIIDNCVKNAIDQFEGQFLHIGSSRFPDLNSVVEYLLPKPKPTKYTHIEEILTLDLPLRNDTFVKRITSKGQFEDSEAYGLYENVLEKKIDEIEAGKYPNLYKEQFFASGCGWYEDTDCFTFEIGDSFEVNVEVVDVTLDPECDDGFNEVMAHITCSITGSSKMPKYISALELDSHCEYECLEESLDILFTEISKCKERYLKAHSK